MRSDDIAEVLRAHFPQPPATESELANFERSHGVPLDPELRAFYAATNGGRLFKWEGPPYYFMPLANIETGRDAIYGPAPDGTPGQDDAPNCPTNVWAFCDVQDGCYVGFEVTPGKPYPIHVLYEDWPREIRVIAPSFAQFLHRALKEGGEYWLG
jgi:hypothetical protein